MQRVQRRYAGVQGCWGAEALGVGGSPGCAAVPLRPTFTPTPTPTPELNQVAVRGRCEGGAAGAQRWVQMWCRRGAEGLRRGCC